MHAFWAPTDLVSAFPLQSSTVECVLSCESELYLGQEHILFRLDVTLRGLDCRVLLEECTLVTVAFDTHQRSEEAVSVSCCVVGLTQAVALPSSDHVTVGPTSMS